MTQLKNDIYLGAGLEVHVSTVDLAHMGSQGWETCLFWDDESEVVAHYGNAGNAIRGHKSFCNLDVIRYVINNRAAQCSH